MGDWRIAKRMSLLGAACMSTQAVSQTAPEPPSQDLYLAGQLGLSIKGCGRISRVRKVKGARTLPFNAYGTFSNINGPKGEAGSSVESWRRRISSDLGAPSYVVKQVPGCMVAQTLVYADNSSFEDKVALSCLVSLGRTPNPVLVDMRQADATSDCTRHRLKGRFVVVAIMYAEGRTVVNGANYTYP